MPKVNLPPGEYAVTTPDALPYAIDVNANIAANRVEWATPATFHLHPNLRAMVIKVDNGDYNLTVGEQYVGTVDVWNKPLVIVPVEALEDAAQTLGMRFTINGTPVRVHVNENYNGRQDTRITVGGTVEVLWDAPSSAERESLRCCDDC